MIGMWGMFFGMRILYCCSMFVVVFVVGLLLLSVCMVGFVGFVVLISMIVLFDQCFEEVYLWLLEKFVIGMGIVMDVGGDVQLCLGVVVEFYFLQCSGVLFDGWSWDDLEGSEFSGQIIWGVYVVFVMFDGEWLESMELLMLFVLYDLFVFEDLIGGVVGIIFDEEFVWVQEDVFVWFDDVLIVWLDCGYVWVQVVWDDGLFQEVVDVEYGDYVVVVQLVLWEIS